jgi:hypothetical protein
MSSPSENKERLMKFLDEVEAMVVTPPAANAYVGEMADMTPENGVVWHMGHVAHYENGLAVVSPHTTDKLLQDSCKDLRVSFACIVQTAAKYKEVVLKEQVQVQKTWIGSFNGMLKLLHEKSMKHKPLIGIDEKQRLFETSLTILFGVKNTRNISKDPQDLRHFFLDNTEFQKHLKLVAKYLELDIPAVKKRIEGNRFTMYESSHDTPAAASTTQDLLLEMKVLCNKL